MHLAGGAVAHAVAQKSDHDDDDCGWYVAGIPEVDAPWDCWNTLFGRQRTPETNNLEFSSSKHPET